MKSVENRHSFDVIGDIHGCYDELHALLTKLGYTRYEKVHNAPEVFSHINRRAVFVGDLCDRGPASDKVLELVSNMVRTGGALCVMGNHDNKLYRTLKGNKTKINNGLKLTLNQLGDRKDADVFKQRVLGFLAALPHQLKLDNGKLIIVHAAARAHYQDFESLSKKKKKAARAEAFYGVVDGKDEDGMPIKTNWAKTYPGWPIVVHGHVAQRKPSSLNNVFNVDTACVYGNKLTALRYPEMEFVTQNAFDCYKYNPRLTPVDKWPHIN